MHAPERSGRVTLQPGPILAECAPRACWLDRRKGHLHLLLRLVVAKRLIVDPQKVLGLLEGILDRVEDRAVGRKVVEHDAMAEASIDDTLVPMDGGAVEDEHAALRIRTHVRLHVRQHVFHERLVPAAYTRESER